MGGEVRSVRHHLNRQLAHTHTANSREHQATADTATTLSKSTQTPRPQNSLQPQNSPGQPQNPLHSHLQNSLQPESFLQAPQPQSSLQHQSFLQATQPQNSLQPQPQQMETSNRSSSIPISILIPQTNTASSRSCPTTTTTTASTTTGPDKTVSFSHSSSTNPKPIRKCGGSSKSRSNHGKECTEILKNWMFSDQHIHFPYPDDAEKADLMVQTGLTKKQLSNWFTNARKRQWLPKHGNADMLKRRKRFGIPPMLLANPSYCPWPISPSMMMNTTAASPSHSPNPATKPAIVHSASDLAIAAIISKNSVEPPTLVWSEDGKTPIGIFMKVDSDAANANQQTAAIVEQLEEVLPVNLGQSADSTFAMPPPVRLEGRLTTPINASRTSLHKSMPPPAARRRIIQTKAEAAASSRKIALSVKIESTDTDTLLSSKVQQKIAADGVGLALKSEERV